MLWASLVVLRGIPSWGKDCWFGPPSTDLLHSKTWRVFVHSKALDDFTLGLHARKPVVPLVLLLRRRW